MKIRASFVPPVRPLVWPLAALLVTVTGVALAGAAALALQAQALAAETPRLEARRARLDAELKGAAQTAALPPMQDLSALRERIAGLNKLGGTRGWRPTELLAFLERSVPSEAWLASLQHRPREGEVLLVAEAPSAEILTTFLLRLEREPRFAEVLLARQGTRQAGTGLVVQFEIRLRQQL